MKGKFKKIIWIIVFVAALYIALNVVFVFFGKTILTSQIEKNLKLKVTFKSVSLRFPFTINISKLDIDGLAKADFISASPSILGLLAGKIILNELRLIKPEITIEKSRNGKINIPQFDSGGKQQPILLAGLNVREGKFIFIDRKLSPAGYRVALNSINLKISKIAFPPTSLFTRFNLSALVGESKGNPRGEVSAFGWIDFRPKDMQGKIELKDIDATYLAPYYGKIIPSENLLSGKLNFTSDLKAKNNDLAAKCHLEFSDLLYDKGQEVEEEKQITDLIPEAFDLFSDASGRLTFDFVINTKLDNPRIDLSSLLGGAIAGAVVDSIANKSPEEIIEKIKDNVGQFKDLGKSLKKMFKKED